MIRLALAQQDFTVGDIPGNLDRARAAIAAARTQGADLVVFPELALTGYPPEDLLLRPGFLRSAQAALQALLPDSQGIDVLIGHPLLEAGRCYNAASWLHKGAIAGCYYKQCLPNYAVFDERRYFHSGQQPLVFELHGTKIGVLICEDAWEPEPALQARAAGAELLLVANASPYRDVQLQARTAVLRQRALDTGLPLVYLNLVGGQDELVFDGRSALVDATGEVQALGPHCEDALLIATFEPADGGLRAEQWPAQAVDPGAEGAAEIYRVLTRGLADYVRKNGFREVVLGLSGGIDSALTLVLAVDALGAEKVHAVMMPSRHTSQLSLDMAADQARQLGVDFQSIEIESAFAAFQGALASAFAEVEPDVTEENLQARIRGNILMALSNKFGWLPLATSNKSELAVGYSTIYGDMCGGFSPLKDCLKTRVYELSRYRNIISSVIPEAVIERPPTAELAPGQLDQDSLPDYAILDRILHRYVDQDNSIQEIVAAGFDEATVRRVAGMVHRAEYKRRQGAPGTRITSRGFGRDRRYPITSGWREDRWQP